MKKINYGKRFEGDFQESAEKVMNIDRLKDPASSFNIKCEGCKNKVTRFSVKNICDFIGYQYPNQYYLELKSVAGKSIPFKNIVKNEKDNRLDKMVEKESKHIGVFSFVVINFRVADNPTYVLTAKQALNYIKTAPRKSIPLDWVKENGIEINSQIKKVRYKYDIRKFLCDIKPF